jgi:hypothetical protein
LPESRTRKIAAATKIHKSIVGTEFDTSKFETPILQGLKERLAVFELDSGRVELRASIQTHFFKLVLTGTLHIVFDHKVAAVILPLNS